MNRTFSATLALLVGGLSAVPARARLLPVRFQAPAAASGWLAALFPDTDGPDRLKHRLRRIEAHEGQGAGRAAGSVTVELRYPGLDGRDEVGQARLFLPPELHDDPARRVALVYNAGYEIDEAGASGLVAKGYAVC